ncbi:MAG: (2Fe-2S) ferredoxin domain-containing protein [Bacteroidales bacterium]|nr:(2Fe-2S) ferredoxin domain-containing protein [Bacteroidales bacterium]
MYKHNIHICLGSSCFSRGNEELLELIKDYLSKNNLKEKTDFRGHLCSGECKCGPNLTIDGQEYHNLKIENIEKILDRHFRKETVTEI